MRLFRVKYFSHKFSFRMAAFAAVLLSVGATGTSGAIADDLVIPEGFPFITEAEMIALGAVVLNDVEVEALYVNNSVVETSPSIEPGFYHVHQDLTVGPMSPWGGGTFRVAGNGTACFMLELANGQELCWRHLRLDKYYFRADMAGDIVGELAVFSID